MNRRNHPPHDVWEQYVLHDRATAYPGGAPAVAMQLAAPRDRILDLAAIVPGDVVLDVGTGDGLLAFGALDRVGATGHVIFHDQSAALLAACQRQRSHTTAPAQTSFLHADATNLTTLAAASVDAIVARCVVMYVPHKAAVFHEWARVLRPQGRFAICEALNYFRFPESPMQLWGIDVTPLAHLAQKIRTVQNQYLQPSTNPLFTFDERDMLRWAEEAGFAHLHLDVTMTVTAAGQATTPLAWELFLRQHRWVGAPTHEACMAEALTRAEAAIFTAYIRPLIERGGGQGRSQGAMLYLWGHKSG